MDWITRNEQYLSELASSELADETYVEVLEDLLDRAQAALDAKTKEMNAGTDQS